MLKKGNLELAAVLQCEAVLVDGRLTHFLWPGLFPFLLQVLAYSP
jgi:hypothetical protein